MYIVLTKPDTDNEKGKLELINGTKEQCDAKVAELINSGISESKIDYWEYESDVFENHSVEYVIDPWQTNPS